MALMKRILWPKRGEVVTILQNGRVLGEGHVLSSDMESITILGEDASTTVIEGKDLSDGMDDGSIIIRKQHGWKGQDI